MTHELTIGGDDEPSNFEITVDGTINPTVNDPAEDAIVTSGSTIEGTVDETALQFQFSGSVTNITVTGDETAVAIDGRIVDPADYTDYSL